MDQSDGGVRYLHHSGEIVIPMEAFVGGNEDQEGLGFKSISLTEWIQKAREAGMNELVAELLSSSEQSLWERGDGLKISCCIRGCCEEYPRKDEVKKQKEVRGNRNVKFVVRMKMKEWCNGEW